MSAPQKTTLPIAINGADHCSNLCPYVSLIPPGCERYGVSLSWSSRKNTPWLERCADCKRSEP